MYEMQCVNQINKYYVRFAFLSKLQFWHLWVLFDRKVAILMDMSVDIIQL